MSEQEFNYIIIAKIFTSNMIILWTVNTEQKIDLEIQPFGIWLNISLHPIAI